MPIIYFQTTQNLLDSSPYILKHSKSINSRLADTALYSIEINTSLRPLNRVKTELSQIWDSIL